VLLSATTAALVSGGLPDGVRQVELGAVRLKDIDEPERVVQLQIDGLPASFPPLRTETEEPMDFGERLSRKIQAQVERQVESALAGDTVEVDVKGTTQLALLGFIPLLMLLVFIALAILVGVLLVRLIT
jgi:hypothetical protein